MKNFNSILKDFKSNVIGAACFNDPITGTRHCANGLTEEEATKFAKINNLKLLNWQAGKKCSQVNCG